MLLSVDVLLTVIVSSCSCSRILSSTKETTSDEAVVAGKHLVWQMARHATEFSTSSLPRFQEHSGLAATLDFTCSLSPSHLFGVYCASTGVNGRFNLDNSSSDTVYGQYLLRCWKPNPRESILNQNRYIGTGYCFA